MTTLLTPGAVKKLKRTTWRFQRTFQTPLRDLKRFVEVILKECGPFEKGTLTIDEVVFEPNSLLALLPEMSKAGLARDVSIEAFSSEQVGSLLTAALADPIDFVFVPKPKPFVVYGDHDEFVTFFANTKSNLNAVVVPLEKTGFIRVENWTRGF
jgi:hypothetical protein